MQSIFKFILQIYADLCRFRLLLTDSLDLCLFLKSTGKQGKQTKREDSQMMPGRQKLKSSSSANEQFQQNQHQNQGKMQGSFRPWSAIVSGRLSNVSSIESAPYMSSC